MLLLAFVFVVQCLIKACKVAPIAAIPEGNTSELKSDLETPYTSSRSDSSCRLAADVVRQYHGAKREVEVVVDEGGSNTNRSGSFSAFACVALCFLLLVGEAALAGASFCLFLYFIVIGTVVCFLQ